MALWTLSWWICISIIVMFSYALHLEEYHKSECKKINAYYMHNTGKCFKPIFNTNEYEKYE